MSERILIVGSGAREHAIAVALALSAQKPALLCYGSAKNPGIAKLCEGYVVGSLTAGDAITAFAREQQATLAVIGPEAPLAAGVADALGAFMPVVGPTKSLARIESSKGFARALLAKHGIAGNPVFRRFTSMDGVSEMLQELAGRHVIKDDGLAGGKGVKVWGDHLHTMEESVAFCEELAAQGHAFVIEEKLEGEEFSLLSFCDGHSLAHMPAAQDHKRAYEGDTGPNTGGMGTYTDAGHSLPFLSAPDIQSAKNINQQVAAALKQECGEPYRGVLYGGFMATRDGVRLIEYNARFGDPECLNLLTLLKTDFVDICRAIAKQTLADITVSFAPQASVCKYVVPEGYPEAPRVGDAVELPKEIADGVTLYLGAVDEMDGRLVATGSRTVGIVAQADTIAAAERLCEAATLQIPGPFFHRSDIGTATALDRRVQHMKLLRGTW